MRIFNEKWDKPGVARWMIRQARTQPVFTGTDSPTTRRLIEACRAYHSPTGTRLLFTRDAGGHSSGFWKNPDYEYCLHLSLSFLDPDDHETSIPHQHDIASQWLDEFYGDHRRLIWTEPPYYDTGKRNDVWHYRLFFHPDWKTPLLPRDEIYTKTNTPAGWLSWSDRQSMIKEQQRQILERIGNA